MQHAVHYLETGSRDPYYNLAFEEYVLTHRTRGDYLLLWQNDNTIVVGQNQNTEAEINRPFVEAHHIHVVRRSTGGGAVYHDLGNLNYSFITDAGDRAALSMARFTQPVVEALQGLGLQAEASGRNDILVEGLHNLASCHIIHYQQQVAVRIVIVVAHADCNVVGINPSDAVGLQKHQGAGLGPTLGVYCLEIAVESPSRSTSGGKQ